MLRLASDADVHGDIVRGLQRRSPDLDLVRAQDFLPERTADTAVLAWAAADNRVLVTNDRNTMVGLAFERVAAAEPMPGVIVTTHRQSIGSAIDDILLVAECMSEDEIRLQVVVFLQETRGRGWTVWQASWKPTLQGPRAMPLVFGGCDAAVAAFSW